MACNILNLERIQFWGFANSHFVELRNVVYEYAIDDIRADNATRSAAEKTLRLHEQPSRHVTDYRGLTQVNRELRLEFLSKYLLARTAYVALEHAHRYFEAYHPLEKEAKDASSAPRCKVFLVVEDMRGPECLKPAFVPKAIDLLPMLDHCMNMSNVDWEFDLNCSGENGSYNMKWALNFNIWFVIKKRVWKVAIKNDLNAILFRYNFDSPMELVFKAISAPSWVKKVLKSGGTQNKGVEPYFRDLGLRERECKAWPIISLEGHEQSDAEILTKVSIICG